MPNFIRASLVAQMVKSLPAVQETWVRSLSWEDPLEKEMETHSSILAWKIPWMKEPGGLPPIGSQRVGYNWSDFISYIYIYIYIGGVGNFLSSVSLQQKFEVMDGPVLQLCVTVQFYLESKGKYILETWGQADPKDAKKKRIPQPNFGSSFYMFFLLPLSLPYVNRASQERCLFYLRSALRSSDLPLFYFHGFFPSLSFSHWHCELLFPILTT